ncbi:MAG: glycosyl hydrolase 53 family protein [Oscillospiraceae bacterium]|nr:glycosyl hydrolase 53 family protein [Oscillospiraceae bacterium]
MKKTVRLIALALAILLVLAACAKQADPEPSPEPQSGPGPEPEPAPEKRTERKSFETLPEVILDTKPQEKIEGSSLYVKKVENLPDDFIMGMDVSSVIALEASGVRYYDFDGTERDLFAILAENGVTHIRVRLWNDPYDSAGRGYGGGNCDIDTVSEIGKRAAANGMKLILDIHYSDFWADPGKQSVPKAWADYTLEEKADAIYNFTRESLERLKADGVSIGMVQIGNETNMYFCGERSWANITTLMKAGAEAVRESCPSALVAIHFANPENATSFLSYAGNLDSYGVDYDVFASSYYPFWHGTFENIKDILTQVSEKYGKKIIIMETSYAYTGADTDFSGNSVSDEGNTAKYFPYTVQGQANAVRKVIETINSVPNGIGICYWEGAWIAVGTESREKNLPIWEEYGSGWATRYAGDYDRDAAKYYGGSSVDNQAFFDPQGHPLESLRIFNLARYGNETEIEPDDIETVSLMIDLSAPIELPETVSAVMTDDSRVEIPVEWNIDAALIEKMRTGGPKTYEITGTAGGKTAKALVAMVEYNFLDNWSFETGELGAWQVEDIGGADQLYVEEKLTDSLTGAYHMHFWSSKKDSVEFRLTQTPEGLESGKYKFSVSIMGGDAGDYEAYAFVEIDGKTVGTAPLQITSYGSWSTGTVYGVEYAAGQALTVGVYVRCSGAGAGAWGKIDDAKLNLS